jgi:hypothetical protein
VAPFLVILAFVNLINGIGIGFEIRFEPPDGELELGTVELA